MIGTYILFICLTLFNPNFSHSVNKRQYLIAKRNTTYDDVYFAHNIIDENYEKTVFLCIAKCSGILNCVCIAYHVDTMCLLLSQEYTKPPSEGNQESGWVYHKVSVSSCYDRPVNTTARDCSEVQEQGLNASGIYTIQPIDGTATDVYCDLTTYGGRWTVFQKRQEGTVDFNLDWQDYRNGFGCRKTDYWIGNDVLHLLTKDGDNELLILMESWDGVCKQARYSNFHISNETDNYRLHLSGFHGNAGDSMHNESAPQNGMQFSTRDRDNDDLAGACNPDSHLGGWWFSTCGSSNLNGKYHNSPEKAKDSCHWFSFSNSTESLKHVQMLVRKN